MCERTTTRLAGIALCLMAFVGVGCDSACNVVYERQLAHIRELADAMPGVSVIEVSGSREELGMDHIQATLHIAGQGSLRVGELTPQSFRAGGSFVIFQVGNYFPVATKYGYFGDSAIGLDVERLRWGSGGGIGRYGHLAELLPVPVTRVQDVVEHFQEIHQSLARWPKCPEFFEHRAGRVCYRLCIADNYADSLSRMPPSFEQCEVM